MNVPLLTSYLHDHLTAAYGGVAMANRIAGSHDDERLTALARDVEADLDALQEIARGFGIRTVPERRPLMALGERLGRLKPNGSWLRRTPLTNVFELEVMTIAVAGKRTGWLTLRQLAADDDRLSPDRLDALISRADEQLDLLDTCRRSSVAQAF